MTSFRDSRFFTVPSQWDPISVKFWGTLYPSAVLYQEPKNVWHASLEASIRAWSPGLRWQSTPLAFAGELNS
jgi:hypothetical protein